MHPLHSHRVLAEKIHEFWVEAPLVARKYRAGQFVIVRTHDRGERIPLTVVQADAANGRIRLIVQEAGKATALMAKFGPGDSFLDVVGPLGKPTHIENWGNLIAVCGGVGAAPLLPIVKAAAEAGNNVFAVIGARSKDLMILEDEFRAACKDVRISTDDGTYGMKGFVTDVLRKWVEEGQKFHEAIIVGPVVMMKVAAALTKDLGIPSLASLNPIMVDGTGMCGGCRVTVHGKTFFACVDGPEFDAHGVDFQELILRNQAYRDQEMRQLEHMADDECKLEAQLHGEKSHV
ncbi:sulfide/dihydroorotate dehydrogenase-like FAD/NAD-binding protein [bacterium]|nr:sulfide/dihydroorotate dehydrogenase-like FAD/NAD-binding protein [bacterium]MBU1985357.1 sulfide/dihydroorotate dehydrogenase-like FAD/NAD-binding protein [bacterium]